MDQRNIFPAISFQVAAALYLAGEVSEILMIGPRPIRWHLASVAGAAGITYLVNVGLVELQPRRTNSKPIEDRHVENNRMFIAGAITETLIAFKEKSDQVTTGHGKFDHIDMWGGTAAIIFAVASVKLTNWIAHRPAKIRKPANRSALNNDQ